MADEKEAHQILIYLSGVENATIAEMEKATGLSRLSIETALKKLTKARSVRRRIEGLCIVYSIVRKFRK